MALCIVQLNITSWKNNKYLFACELSNLHPDIILLNETGQVPNNIIKFRGFKSIYNSLDVNLGVAILVKNDIPFTTAVQIKVAKII